MKYVVIGASAAGISGAKTLRELDKEAEIVLISKDSDVYSRCILHHYIDGRRDIKALDFTPKDFFNMYNIKWIKGVEVLKINPSSKTLELSNGSEESYEKLLVATGSSSFIPPIENLRTANNVIGLRNLEDAVKIKELANTVKSCVVLGAGLVGIDALAGLLDFDLKVSLVEMGERVLPLQLDKEAASAYERIFKEKGVDLKLGVKAERVVVDENNNPKSLIISTGESVPCEMIIVSTGVRSNVALFEGSGVETDKLGLIINEKGETNTKDIYGAGDVTGRNPIWPTAVKEGIIAANNMVGKELYLTDFFGSKNTMNFCGLATMSLGIIEKPDESYSEVVEKKGDDYKKIIYKGDTIYGAILQGDLSYAGILTQLIKEKIDVSKVKKSLFDIDYADFFNIKENLEYTF